VLRRIFRTTIGGTDSRLKTLKNENCGGLYSPINITRMIKSKE
jgi:hypothetical protein